jgi:hypothetical protein
MRALGLLLPLLATACAGPAFVANQGRVTPRGSFRVAAGTGYHLNTQIADLVRDGRDAARALWGKRTACADGGGSCWRVEDLRPVADAAFRSALVSPASSRSDLSARYGFARRLDAGVHLGPGTRGVDLGLQTFGPLEPVVPGWSGTLLAGVGTRSLGAVGEVVERVLRGDAGLTELQLAHVVGRQWGEVVHAYGGARYTLTRWSLRVTPELPVLYEGEQVQALLDTDTSGVVHHYGALLGAALGWRHLFVGAELNVIATSGRARVLGRERDLGGVGLLPAAYVYGQY